MSRKNRRKKIHAKAVCLPISKPATIAQPPATQTQSAVQSEKGAIPMNNTKKTNQHIAFVALEEMEANTGYQRPTDSAQVNDIVVSFNESKLGLITVSHRDGMYHIIDGGHRSRALRILGYTHALCEVFTGMTYEQEADYFRSQDTNKRRLTPYALFKSGIEAKDETCLRINDIVKANGFQVTKSGQRYSKIAAIGALYTIVAEYGFAVLDKTLCLVAGTWENIDKATQSETLLGVAEFVKRYGMVDFAERLNGKCHAIWFDYCETTRSRFSSSSGVSRRKFCQVLVHHYNKGLGATSKKRLVWEDAQ